MASALPLRMPQASGAIDPEPFRIAASGGAPLRDSMAPSGGMRTVHLPPGQRVPLFDLASPLLTFVMTGSVELDTIDRGPLRLGRGDVFLMEAGGPRDDVVHTAGDCRLLQVMVDADWPGPKARPARAEIGLLAVPPEPLFKRMSKGADARSRFSEFAGLFGPPGRWSAVRPVAGLRFIAMADDTFIDWHPEVTNNLVVVMSGGLELEVGGAGGDVQVFWPGDVCLAEDRTGEGHIDRVHGHVQVCVLVMDDAHLWPRSAAVE